MKNQPLISVVIPVYNAKDYLHDALDSLLNQTYENLEIIIADDGSTDNSLEILHSYQDNRIKFLHNESNQGYLKTCNKLLLAATGDFVTFQDADDISYPNRMKIIVEYLQNNPECKLLTTDYTFINNKSEPFKKNEYQVDFKKLRQDPGYKPYLCGQTIMVHRALIEQYGVYHPFFDRLGGEDYEWLFRIATQSDVQALHIPQNLYQYRVHQSAVKLGNKDIKKFFILDIVFFIKAHYVKTKQYYLADKYYEEFLSEIKKWEEGYKKNPAKIHIIQSSNAINAKEYKLTFIESFQAIKKQPFYWKVYQNLIYKTYLIIRKQLQ